MIARLGWCVAVAAIAAAGGCSPYLDDVHYRPHPAVADIRTATTQPNERMQSPVTVYATIVGIRRADSDAHLPLSVEVRLRLDNHGPQAIFFDPRSLDLTNGELLRFPPPIVAPPEPVSISPGQSFVVQANFPLPSGVEGDGGGGWLLQLHWAVRIDGHVIPQTANFHRIRRYYDDPYWDYGPYPYYYGAPDLGVGGTIVIR